MKIHIEHEDVKLVFEAPQLVPRAIIEQAVSAIYDTLKYMVEESHVPILPDSITEKVSKEEPPKERPAFRDRLPNNVVNIEDLTIKQAVTEQALVRCSSCGQSHVLAVSSGSCVYMMRKFYSAMKTVKGFIDEFKVIAEFDSFSSNDFVNMCCREDTDRKAYFEDIQSLPMIDNKDFGVNNDTEIFCPVCHASNAFIHWKNAYENPLEYFETAQICDACGGEVLSYILKDKTVGHRCEKCGYDTGKRL